MNLTEAIYDRLAGDATLTAMLSTYRGAPAIFTVDPAPEDAVAPFVVTAGHVADVAFDTKTTLGREVWRDVRCYTGDKEGSALVVEAVAERVRVLLHRHKLVVTGFTTMVAECSGPVVADEQGAFGRIVTVRLMMEGA